MTPDSAAVNWDEYPIELPVSGFAVLRIEFGVPFYIWAYGSGKKHMKLLLGAKFVLAEPIVGRTGQPAIWTGPAWDQAD